MSLDRYVLKSLLNVEAPWTIDDYTFDPRRRRLEVVVGRDSGRHWFGLPRARADTVDERQWRHVNVAGWHTHVRLRLPVGAALPEAPWCGDTEHPFTRGLAQRVFVLFNEGLSLRSICTVLDLPLDEVWKYRYALDSGRAGFTRPAGAAAAAGRPASREDEASPDGVPEPTAPVWLDLLEGKFDLDIRALSLKLLLANVRAQFEVIRDDEVRMLKLREVHRYFVKNGRMLAHELEQISRH